MSSYVLNTCTRTPPRLNSRKYKLSACTLKIEPVVRCGWVDTRAGNANDDGGVTCESTVLAEASHRLVSVKSPAPEGLPAAGLSVPDRQFQARLRPVTQLCLLVNLYSHNKNTQVPGAVVTHRADRWASLPGMQAPTQ